MPRDAGRLFGNQGRAAQGGMASTLPAKGTARQAPVQRQGAVDAYAAYMGSQQYATPQTPPSGKYGGFKTQSQLYTAIQGGADAARDSAVQYASELRGAADQFGRKTADEAALRQREAQQAWQDAQRQKGAALKARAAGAATRIAGGRDAANAEWLQGFDPERARSFGAMSRGNQAASQRYAAQAGLDAVDVTDSATNITSADEWDRYVSKMATQFADQSARPEVMAARADKGTGAFGAARQAYGDQAAASLVAGPQIDTGQSVEDMAGFSMADYMKDLQGAVNPRLEAARTDRDTAEAIASTPWSQYAQMIGENVYGLDPNLVRGQFDEGLDNSRFKEERDAQSVAQFGMPFSEYQSAQRQAESDAMAAQRAAQAEAEGLTQAQLDALAEEVTAVTGRDATALANSTDLPVMALAQVLASPDYQTAVDSLETARSAGDAAEFDATLGAMAQYDPTLYRVLQAQYADFVDSGFDPLDDTTWRQG